MLVAAARENADDDNASQVAARNLRLQNIAEAYIGLLARSQMVPSSDVAGETFGLADTIRGQSVRQALTASSARMSAKDPALTELIRQEQDLAKQINAQLGALNNALSLPAEQRDETVVKAIHAAIGKARGERDKARAEITRRFPSYADLVDPKPPTVESVRETLREDEALLSFYFGREKSFVWAVPKRGAVAFAPIALTAGDLETKVRKLQEALNPEVHTIGDIPAFDVAGAYELYRVLLEPVEEGWRRAKSLDRCDQRCPRLAADFALADSRGRCEERRRAPVCVVSRCAMAGAHPCGLHGSFGGCLARTAPTARWFQQTRSDHRFWRSVFQHRAGS